ncbi:hypothetical protein GYA49_01175, partial [Candidatus Beckwithbacteria bacterium]|nr:hypothetical protein [Candidatus Beckwithbacteria bacterium]
PAELQAQFDTSFLLELPNYSDKEVVNKIQELSSQLAKLSLRDRLSRLRDQLPQTQAESRDKLKRQINDVLVRLRRYN